MPVSFRATLTYPFRLGNAGEDWLATKFGKLAVINNLSAAGDALVVVALAGSVFVSVSIHAARSRTALGLLCTMLPFAVVAPLTGPFTDRVRRGRGFVVVLAAAGRVAAVVMMIMSVHSLLLFPAAFVGLVCSKTHSVARAALVPTVVPDESQLVSANAKLAVGGGITSALAAGLGSGIYAVLGPKAVLDLDIFIFALLAVVATELVGPTSPAGPIMYARSIGRIPISVRRAAIAVGGIRSMTGLMTALVVFAFRSQGAPVIWYGLVAIGGVGGNIAGAVLAPLARSRLHSNRLLIALSCLSAGITASIATQLPGRDHRIGALALALVAGVAGSVAKTSFDATVQTCIPEAVRARSIGKLEALFQASWVLAALVPTAFALALPTGFSTIATVLILVGIGLMHPICNNWRIRRPGD